MAVLYFEELDLYADEPYRPADLLPENEYMACFGYNHLTGMQVGNHALEFSAVAEAFSL
ncbi:hypothetical protein [Pantoea stewartii]|uniref:hypothetical protein n=1 Tax=Pantoea stewartii TaxID=66269 RepID=UPI0025A09D89|nr:hypothetical protein [Pantoea stewartii]